MAPTPAESIEHLLARAAAAPPSRLPAPPALALCVLTCMDARIDPLTLLGLEPGQAHVIRNAGALADDGAVRSLAISQRTLGTRGVLVLGHTGCGLLGVSDEDFAERVALEAGARPPWRPGGFADLEESVRATVRALRRSPFLLYRDAVRGAVVDLDRGGVRPVGEPSGAPPTAARSALTR